MNFIHTSLHTIKASRRKAEATEVPGLMKNSIPGSSRKLYIRDHLGPDLDAL